MRIEELKQQTDIIEVADRLGIKIEKNHKAKCPFHGDKNPSLQFSREKQIATCFSGNCDAGTMDVVSLVEKKLKLTTSEALKWINPIESKRNKKGNRLLEDLIISSSRSFKLSKPAKSYADLRGLIREQCFLGETFYQGWSEKQKQEAESIGLIKKYRGSFYQSAFKNRLIYFLRDKEGQLVSLYGRAIDVNNKVDHLYLKSGQKGLFPSYPSQETKRLILTESIIDAESLLQESIEGFEVLALYGTNGLTAEHIEAIKGLENLEEIIFFFDGDSAGNTAISKYVESLKELKVKLSRVNTPESEDINSLMVGHGAAGELFGHLLAERSLLFSNDTALLASEKANEKEKIELPNTLMNKVFDTSNSNSISFIADKAIYSVKGGIAKGFDSLKVTLVVESDNRKSRLKLDLYEDKQIIKSAKEIADKLHLDPEQIERELNDLTDHLEEWRENRSNPQKELENDESYSFSSAQKQQALTLLKDKDLMKRINTLIGKSGIVGEQSARQSLFIIAISYLIKKPLHGLIQGSSGSGKTHLMNKILDLLPSKKVVRITRVTESSFYNYEENFFNHKILGMEDLDGLEEKALFAFRELQSKGEITSSTTIKDELTGELSAGIRRVRGPIASLSCTTQGEVYEDNMSRSFLIAVNESQNQTDKILHYQQKKAAGEINEVEEQKAVDQIQAALSLLKSYKVINPYATKISLPKEAHKIRRLHELFQYFVQTITLLNQYQREKVNETTIVSDKEDVRLAIEIMFDSIMLKVDELDGSLRGFYEKLKEYLKTHDLETFLARDIRQSFLISKTQLHRYLNELLELEYIEKVNGHKNVGYRYKITYWDNIEKLRNTIKIYLNEQLEKL